MQQSHALLAIAKLLVAFTNDMLSFETTGPPKVKIRPNLEIFDPSCKNWAGMDEMCVCE